VASDEGSRHQVYIRTACRLSLENRLAADGRERKDVQMADDPCDRLQDPAALWSIGDVPWADVVTCACDALVAGIDTRRCGYWPG
jgi:hypothetical protein